MGTVLYRCPNFGMATHAWIDDVTAAAEENVFLPIVCVACQRMHLLNPRTGRLATDPIEKLEC